MRISCCRPPRSSSIWTWSSLTATTTWWPTIPRSRRWAKANPIRKYSACWPRRWGLPSPASTDSDETHRSGRGRRGLGFRCGARGGLEAHRARQGSRTLCRRRLRHALRQGGVLLGKRAGAGPRSACPITSRRRKTRAARRRSRYPLAMISPPARNFLNSSFVNVQSLRATEGEPWLDIHPDDAAPRGVIAGSYVRVFNDRGSLELRARVTDRARRGVVVALVGVVEEAHPRRQERQRTHQQRYAHRYGTGADVLRLPGAGRSAVSAYRRTRVAIADAGSGNVAIVHARRARRPARTAAYAELKLDKPGQRGLDVERRRVEMRGSRNAGRCAQSSLPEPVPELAEHLRREHEAQHAR